MARRCPPARRPLAEVIAAGLITAFTSLNTFSLPFEISEDIRGVWNNSLVAGAAIRASDPDKQLVGAGNASEYAGAKGAVNVADDGNLNYHEGDVISAPLIYTTDLELRYKSRYGVYGKARTWYDHVGEKREVPHGSITNGYKPNANLNDSDYYDYNKFSGAELLDLYVYGNWDIGESRLTARLGQQSINWGESLMHVGINGFNPLNFSALGRPGVRQDDALVPVNRIYSNLITRNGISLEAFYALAWEASRLPPCGSLGQAIDDIVDPGCNYATAAAPLSDQQQFNYRPDPQQNPLLTPRSSQDNPGSGGQYGLSSRYFLESLNTEFGLYYVNYHATNPVLDLTLCEGGWEGCSSQDGFSLPLKFHKNVKAVAISAATGVRNVALSAELSHFKDLPAQRNFPELIEGATQNRGIYAERMVAAEQGSLFSGGWKADRSQLLLGGVMDLASAIGLADATLAAEFSGQWTTNLPGAEEERIGRNPNWGAAASAGECQAITQATEGGCKVEGYATDFSWGYRLVATISLPRPARGVDLLPLLAWNHDVEGYAIDGSQLEGRQVIALRLRAIFQQAYFLDIGRSWVKSTTDFDAARDKDVYSIAVGLVF